MLSESNGNLVIDNTNADELQSYIIIGTLRYFLQPYFMQNFNNSSLRHLCQDCLLFAYGSDPLMSTYLYNCQLNTRSFDLDFETKPISLQVLGKPNNTPRPSVCEYLPNECNINVEIAPILNIYIYIYIYIY